MAATPTTTILEQCKVAPSQETQPKLSLPLTFLDLHWLPFHEIQRLLFYNFPCSKTDFINNIIPTLKQSLSITLKHFLPFSGNIIYPLDGTKPEIQCSDNDAVSITFAESSSDFSYFTEKTARKAVEFHPFVPFLPPAIKKSDHKIIPLLALQVTLFPENGLCIGYSNHHAVSDGSTVVSFIKAWASIHKHGGDDHLIGGNLLPVYDRSVINYKSELDEMTWNQVKYIPVQESLIVNPERVRVTYVLNREKIQILKNLVLGKNPALGHVSAFTVTCGCVWSCLVKAYGVIQSEPEQFLENSPQDEYFLCPVDCRARLDPPAPQNYFGNCIAPCLAKVRHEEIMGSEGFVFAAEAIGKAIHKFVKKEGGVLVDADKWLLELNDLNFDKVVGVAGSPKFDIYDVDYGWGKPKSFEAISIDFDNKSMSLNKSREYEGGLEVDLSMPKAIMDVFASIFQEGFKILL